MTTSPLSQPIRPEQLPNGGTIPWPGQPWPGIDGSIYAGLCPGDLASAPYHLVLLADEPASPKQAFLGGWWAGIAVGAVNGLAIGLVIAKVIR